MLCDTFLFKEILALLMILGYSPMDVSTEWMEPVRYLGQGAVSPQDSKQVRSANIDSWTFNITTRS